MITAEMRNMMIRDQLMNDISEIKKDIELIRTEVYSLNSLLDKLTKEKGKVDNGWRHYED